MPLPPTDALHQAAGILRLVLFGFSSASCMIEPPLPEVALTDLADARAVLVSQKCTKNLFGDLEDDT
ncbi:hypothetical protein H2248_000150 [Termitomyces sp. 'cryptogamus']|nr:hypothetical protein H2248_000150 [Termitomyces sp. 'cryptogamus']